MLIHMVIPRRQATESQRLKNTLKEKCLPSNETDWPLCIAHEDDTLVHSQNNLRWQRIGVITMHEVDRKKNYYWISRTTCSLSLMWYSRVSPDLVPLPWVVHEQHINNKFPRRFYKYGHEVGFGYVSWTCRALFPSLSMEKMNAVEYAIQRIGLAWKSQQSRFQIILI